MADNVPGEKLKAIDKIRTIMEAFQIPEENPKNRYAKKTTQQFMLLSNHVIDTLYNHALMILENENGTLMLTENEMEEIDNTSLVEETEEKEEFNDMNF